jgi:hypothetical protein
MTSQIVILPKKVIREMNDMKTAQGEFDGIDEMICAW